MSARLPRLAIGLASALVLLAVALARAPLAGVAATLARADPAWLAGALLAYGVGLSVRARRWQMILRPVAIVPYRVVARVLLVGNGLNTLLPARIGELCRVEFFKTTRGLARLPVLTSIVVERLFDGSAVVACLAGGLLLAPGAPRTAAPLIGIAAAGAVLFGSAMLAALAFGRLRLSFRLARWPELSAWATAVERGLVSMHGGRSIRAALLTLLIYLPEGLSLWLVVRAVGLPLGVADTAVLVGVTSLGTLLPSGPAYLGTLQFAYVLAIEFAGGQPATGIAAATLAQLCLLLPIAILAVAVLLRDTGSLALDALAAQGSLDRSMP